jgi:hypothetical protein
MFGTLPIYRVTASNIFPQTFLRDALRDHRGADSQNNTVICRSFAGFVVATQVPRRMM